MKRISILLLVLFVCFALAAWSQARPQLANKIITFEAPGAGKGAFQGTQAFGVNWLGEIVGFYYDPSGATHSFLRQPNGTFKEFDPTGSTSTFSIAINQEGAVAGYYVDANNVWHGYLRAPDGTITTFDALGAGTGAGQGTIAGDINDLGVIAGYYTDANNVSHGFLRTPEGIFSTFDAPGAGTGAGPRYLPHVLLLPYRFRGEYGILR